MNDKDYDHNKSKPTKTKVTENKSGEVMRKKLDEQNQDELNTERGDERESLI